MLYPILLAPLAAALGAMGRRWSGGLLSEWLHRDIGTQAGRAVWGACLAAVALAGGAPLWLALVLGAGFPLGSAIRGQSPGLAARNWTDAGWLTLHGAATVALPCAVALWSSDAAVWPMALAGVLCAPCYFAAWRWPLGVSWLARRAAPTETAELAWGALLALGLATAVL